MNKIKRLIGLHSNKVLVVIGITLGVLVSYVYVNYTISNTITTDKFSITINKNK